MKPSPHGGGEGRQTFLGAKKCVYYESEEPATKTIWNKEKFERKDAEKRVRIGAIKVVNFNQNCQLPATFRAKTEIDRVYKIIIPHNSATRINTQII
jgi:hypothetical protein